MGTEHDGIDDSAGQTDGSGTSTWVTGEPASTSLDKALPDPAGPAAVQTPAPAAAPTPGGAGATSAWPQPGASGVAPGGGVPAPMPVTSTGAMAWWCMFFSYIPFVGGLAWLVVALVTYLRERSNPFESARLNARNGLNWMLTYTAVQVVIFVLIALVVVFASANGSDEGTVGLFVIPLYLLACIWGITAIVTAIKGGIAAGRGEVHAPSYLITFVR